MRRLRGHRPRPAVLERLQQRLHGSYYLGTLEPFLLMRQSRDAAFRGGENGLRASPWGSGWLLAGSRRQATVSRADPSPRQDSGRAGSPQLHAGRLCDGGWIKRLPSYRIMQHPRHRSREPVASCIREGQVRAEGSWFLQRFGVADCPLWWAQTAHDLETRSGGILPPAPFSMEWAGLGIDGRLEAARYDRMPRRIAGVNAGTTAHS